MTIEYIPGEDANNSQLATKLSESSEAEAVS